MGQEENPFFKTDTRGFEWAAFKYEWPLYLFTLLAACSGALLYTVIVRMYDPFVETWFWLILLGVMIAVALLPVIWAASYYPKAVSVRKDRIEFKMSVGKRGIPFSEIEAVRALPDNEIKGTFRSFQFMNLSPAVSGAVIVERKGKRAWVFSPEDAEGFVAAAESARSGKAPDTAGAPENETKEEA